MKSVAVSVHYRYIHKGHVLKLSTVRRLGPALAHAAAKRLACVGEELTEDNVEVVVTEYHEIDTSPVQVMIVVKANRNPYREIGIAERIEGLGNDIRQMLPMHVGFELRLALEDWFSFAAEPSPFGLGDLMENPPAGILE